MDEGLLNDLLECSVCLERLDTSSRVLPCQHTFCLKCLKEIVESHKELRCPECRVLVETKVEELPPNVLLMRILEGMKNSAPRKISGQRIRSGHSQIQQLQQSSRSESKQLPPHARAMYDYISKEPGDLSFKKGETILLQKKLDTFWFQGEISGRTGMFPITFVQVVVPLPMSTALCKALYDFRMSAPDEEGCLAFDKGAIISVHRRVDENWAEGRLDQRVGIFPIAFVELNHAARQLMNSQNFSTSITRPVPPVPDVARSSHSDRHHGSQLRGQPMSLSTPTTGQGNYQNLATMSQSHTNYHANHAQTITQPQILIPQPVNQHVTVNQVVGTRNGPIMEPTTKHLDLIHFTNVHNKGHQTMGIQSVSRITENYDRLRGTKFDNYNSTPVQKVETTYQNVRAVNFTNNSSDSSSSVNTPSGNAGSSTTTPNTSSNTSTCESAEPSLPSSPDNVNTERSANVSTQEEENQESLNASGALSLNESSTATNTSLNVSLPPTESPKNLNQTDNQENTELLEVPSSSINVMSGPNSLFNFGLGLQAALSPSHKDSNYMVTRGHRDHREREKRHSLTPSSHLQSNHMQNRHSAEILATSLLDHGTERERERPERERDRRRRRSGSNEKPLPAAYIALYAYKPQKPDELELKKGGVYTVTERCRDGWFKGCCERVQRCGVFPGNYVAPLAPLATLTPLAHGAAHGAAHARVKHDKQNTSHTQTTTTSKVTTTSNTSNSNSNANPTLAPPDAPPRASSPLVAAGQPLTYPWSSMQPQQTTPRTEKPKEKSKSDKSSISTGVSLMKRLAAMKKCKSPPPVGYSMDNPVFEDGPGPSHPAHPAHPAHPVHVRSGSCPSQLLRSLPASAPAPASAHANAQAAASARARHRDQRAHSRGSGEVEWAGGHRKSASLDVTARRDRHHSQPIKEKFRCIVPYPPNSEYELELKVDDIVIVCKKRGDGWYKGTLQRTGRTGLFPASFVQSCPPD